MNTPRLFVGTLFCGEAEYDECRAAILSQEGVRVTHHIIENQPEFSAHNILWQAWIENRGAHDLFVKIDADTILNRPTALADIAALFKAPDVTGAQILLHDYFTDDLIAGLNAFSKSVQFRASRSRLFADHADFGHQTVLKGESVEPLAPIGWHCRHPHPYQAFHYGFHRALKRQTDMLAKCARIWREKPENGRAWALAGAASAHWWHRRSMDYGNSALQALFARLQDDGERRKKVLDYAERVINREAKR
jgi:hypothetical protein